MAKALELDGQTIGWLRVIERAETPEGQKGLTYKAGTWWRCRCRCRKEIVVSAVYLRQSEVPNCGCRKRETAKDGGKAADAKRKPTAASRKIGHDGKIRVEDVKKAAEQLQEAEKLYGVMRNDHKCRVCGKVFDRYAGKDWAWRMKIGGNDVYFCSYGCMRKIEAKRFPQKKAGGYAY